MMESCTVLAALAACMIAVCAMAKPEKPAKAKAEVTARKMSFDTVKKDKHGKAVVREFPTMFDIAQRSKDHKARKGKPAKSAR